MILDTHLSQDSITRLISWCFIYAMLHPEELDRDKWGDLFRKR